MGGGYLAAAPRAIELSVLPNGPPQRVRVFFEQVIRDNLDIGRPDQVGLVFDRRGAGQRPLAVLDQTSVIGPVGIAMSELVRGVALGAVGALGVATIVLVLLGPPASRWAPMTCALA